ncbi:putative SOS response-associated peptidase YedK [Kushneria sinocarnis]|uniref:Abasic site processing protein n=2 Tax=Kushneria sinocarnis TaxID=595502 RepID=A0A420X1I6_9GAMM|nr:putative SOS response-associated peptidase YedK [Kushneria sinocarnis]
MCGRYALFTRKAQLLDQLPLRVRDADDDAGQPRYNVAPGTEVLAVRRASDDDENTAITLDRLWWGYHPHWAGDSAPTPINAKAEKVATSKYYAGAFARQRCLIPADGWYEWLATEHGKQPHFICRQDRSPVWLAGIWSARPDGTPGLAIITHDARGVATEVHSRMPLALDERCLTEWLDPHMTDRESVRQLIRPLPAELLSHWPVSREVNRVGNDRATLIEPINPA